MAEIHGHSISIVIPEKPGGEFVVVHSWKRTQEQRHIWAFHDYKEAIRQANRLKRQFKVN